MPDSMLYKIVSYPDFSEVTLDARNALHPYFKGIEKGISEFTFANIYFFRKRHNYTVSTLPGGAYLIAGRDGEETFFMLPSGPAEESFLAGLFLRFDFMKCVSEGEAALLKGYGYIITEDRDNFDYIYLRKEQADLSGRRFHKKKNLVNLFVSEYVHSSRPLLKEYIDDALKALEDWRVERGSEGDYEAARDALVNCEEVGLCGYVFYVDGRPAAYTLGEELGEDTFVVHFEKGLGAFKGLLQFVNQSFAALLPDRYLYINREQDVGDVGLRKSKMSYRPAGFIKKYRASTPRP